MSKATELAENLERSFYKDCEGAAAELRRLDDVNDELHKIAGERYHRIVKLERLTGLFSEMAMQSLLY